jgi:hypothetical protein
MLEGARMLRLNVHMDGTLVLLCEVAMGALKLAGLGADILERHGDCWLTQAENSIFVLICQPIFCYN